MKLYTNPMSSNSKRVEVLAAELGIPLQKTQMNLGAGELRQPGYVALNPNSKIPTLITDDGFVLWESRAIMQYLCDTSPGQTLMPTDPRGRAEVNRWLFWHACHLGAAVGAIVMERLVKPALFKQPPDEARVAAELKEADRFLPILNAHLEGKEWVTGAFSIVDIAMGTNLEMGPVVGVAYAAAPHVQAWLQRLQNRPSWTQH